MITHPRWLYASLLALAVLAPVPAVAQSPRWMLVGTWGSPGSYGAGGFTTTLGVAADPFGYVYATDPNWIVKLIGGSHVVTAWNPHGASSSSSNIQSVAVDRAGNVFIAEHNTGTIQKFTGTGSFITQWAVPGSGSGQGDWMTGLAVDANGTVYLADANRRRVMRFASTGAPLADLPGTFLGPTGVAIDAGGYVYVADYSRVVKFSNAGAYLMEWGTSGNGPGQFGYARGIAVDVNAGYIYVTDVTYPRVQQFTTAGTFISQWGQPGSGSGAMACPPTLAVDAGGDVYVADTCNFTLMQFRWGLAPVPVAKRSWGQLKGRYR